MKRILLIPAAGRGSRLGSDRPKLLHPVAGKPMLDRLVGLYRGRVDGFVLVVHPDAEAEVRTHCEGLGIVPGIFHQAQPTGMLDAILGPRAALEEHRPDSVWITWCDQIAVQEPTVQQLEGRSSRNPPPLVVFPTGHTEPPYIHFDRDAGGTIVKVLQRREGDAMPERGEADSGLFALSAEAYFELLPRFAAEATQGDGTGERNFLPFLPWAASRGEVETFPVTDPREQIGVNTPEDAARLEGFLDG